MRKKIILIILLLIVSITMCKASSDFNFNLDKLFESDSKNTDVANSFNPDYNITYKYANKDEKLEEEIKALAKKTTYLLFGDFNNTNESSEHFYKRKKDFYNLAYNPTIPKTADGKEDPNSQEDTYKSIASFSMNSVFPQAVDLGLIYKSFGDIRVIKIDEKYVICFVTLPDVKIKSQSKSNPFEYEYKITNYIMSYHYRNNNGVWQLYYLYGEDSKSIAEYFNEAEESKSKTMAIAPTYDSELSKIYSFDKLNKLTEKDYKSIYNANIDNIVTLKSYYNNYVIATAQGFFINDGLVATTWNFLEKSLVEAQYITLSNNETIELEGIVTANPENDIAILKVKKHNLKVKLGEYNNVNIEDPAILVNKESGVGSKIQTGIVISNKNYIQISIPISKEDEGNPVFNQYGEVIGMLTSKLLNASMSMAINSVVLSEVQNKFNNIDYDKIESISFEELKEKYYYLNYGDEKTINDIPSNKWNEYSKVGNIKETIKLELIKANYADNIVSLRYKNKVAQYITSMQLAASFKEQLVQDGYKETFTSDSKCIYTNDKYRVIIMDEFDYLIVVMVKL